MNGRAEEGAMEENRRPRQASHLVLFGIVFALILMGGGIVWYGGEQPPRPLVPDSTTHKRALELSNKAVSVFKWRTPIRIVKGQGDGIYVVSYWTPHKEIELLGQRAVVVDIRSNTADILMRD